MAHGKSGLEMLRAIQDTDSESNSSDSTVQANPRPDPRYLYYRIFTEHIAIPLHHPVFPGNSYVGRVRANSVAPPHTAALVRRRICKVEGISDLESTLFCDRASRSPIDDGERMSILTSNGPGSNPEEPMELVIQSYPRWGGTHSLSAKILSPKPRYIYYNLYTDDGEIPTEHPINRDNDESPSLARIDNNLVPPPHTINSIIRCISYVEGFPYNFWHRLFLDITSESPLNSSDILILRRGGPGSAPEKPLTFVCSNEMTKRMRIKYPVHNGDAGLLPVIKNAILYTNGVVRREALTPHGKASGYSTVYRAHDHAGQNGFVETDNVNFI